MAKRQYRLSTEANWQSMFGQAILAITNVSGSGRKLTLRSFEVGIQSIAGSTVPMGGNATLWQCSSASGEDMTARSVRFDSGTAMPSGVVVRRGGGGDAYTNILRRVVTTRSGSAAGTQNVLATQRSWSRIGGLIRSPIRDTGVVEPITVPTGSAIVLMSDIVRASVPLRVHAVVNVSGKTVVWEYVTATRPGLSLFSLENTGAATVMLLRLGIQEVGTTDTPYLRMVPVGQIYGVDFDDTSKQLPGKLTPMDSTYPSLDSVCKVYTDVGFVPLGVPENYMTATTAGSPRGFNYLHTKDFNGPVLRIFFPEMECNKPGGTNEDMKGYCYGHRNADIGVLYSGITINPGEGVAIVASAETAVGVTAAFSGWPSLLFSAQIDDEPFLVPTIGATGMVTGSRYRVERVSDSSLVTTGVVDGTGAFSFLYDVEDVPLNLRLRVRKGSSAPFYKPYEVTFYLTTAGISIPVSQISDD